MRRHPRQSRNVPMPAWKEDALPLTLLVVEDDPDIAAVLAFAAGMRWPGCRVTIARGGEEALCRFAEPRPALVVLDAHLPPPDGFEVVRQIREVAAVPVLLLAACDAAEDHARAVTLGAEAYRTKPCDAAALLARLAWLLDRERCRAGPDHDPRGRAGG